MLTVLLVDTDADFRGMVAETLRDHGYEVLEAETGKRTVELLASQPEPCLVLADLTMPVLSSVEFLKTLQGTHRIAALPVVIMSVAGEPGQVPQATQFVRQLPSDSSLLQLVAEFCAEPPKLH